MHVNRRIYLQRSIITFLLKKLLGNMPTVLITVGKWDDNPPNQIITPRWSRALSGTEKGMYINQMIYTNPHVSSMALVINQMNAKYWGTLVQSILKAGLLRTAGTIPKMERNLTDSKITPLFLITQWRNNSARK